jgi:hemoglobin
VTNASLFERIGGEEAIMAAVARFYRKVMGDDLTRPFFADMDIEAQTRKQVAFLAWAFGAPERYKGRDLRSAHAQLVSEAGLNDVHFDCVVRHLRDTLRELDVPGDLAEQALHIVEGLREEVLGR